MADSESRVRAALVTYFPMLIAVLSLLTSIYSGYLNNKFVGIIQGNLSRGEYLRTCKEIIDAYFQVKFKAGLIPGGGDRTTPLAGQSGPQIDAANAANHFGALGTYLANLRDDPKRERYTQLSRQLESIVNEAPRLAAGQLDKLFEPADQLFAEMNDDCVRSAKAAP
jgi:hypothetical protein